MFRVFLEREYQKKTASSGLRFYHQRYVTELGATPVPNATCTDDVNAPIRICPNVIIFEFGTLRLAVVISQFGTPSSVP